MKAFIFTYVLLHVIIFLHKKTDSCYQQEPVLK
nr:MAG TPA: hypothetical protein [Caudoviricetes sp.]